MEAPPPHVHDITMEGSKHASNDQNMHTPPASDMSSHDRKEDDDDAASSSELSELDDQFEGAPQPSFAQDVPMEDAPAVVEPDRYEGGIPIFQPVCPNLPCLKPGAFVSSARSVSFMQWEALTDGASRLDNGPVSGFREVHEWSQSIRHEVWYRPYRST
jgi:hypothetical protein